MGVLCRVMGDGERGGEPAEDGARRCPSLRLRLYAGLEQCMQQQFCGRLWGIEPIWCREHAHVRAQKDHAR